MKITNFHTLFITLAITFSCIAFSMSENYQLENEVMSGNTENKAVSIVGNEPFDKMMSALTHKRCVNCHPAGDRPLQGEDSRIHNYNVQRGIADSGIGSLNCQTCHQKENNNLSGVPGNEKWQLAPRKMVWEGLTRVEIARSITNPKINGGKTLKEIVTHLTEDELVLWAWEPGISQDGTPREKPPISKEEYIKAVKDWYAAGAIIPEK